MSLPLTVRLASLCMSPVSQEYIPESSGSVSWMSRRLSLPFLRVSYLSLFSRGMLFLLHVTGVVRSEVVQDKVAVSPSMMTVSRGFFSMSTLTGQRQVNSQNVYTYISVYTLYFLEFCCTEYDCDEV